MAAVFIFLLAGCGHKYPDNVSNVFNELHVGKYSVEDTDMSVEKNYDANTLLIRGESYFDKKSYAEARGEFERFTELHPYHKYVPHAYYKIGLSYLNEFNGSDRTAEPLGQAAEVFDTLVKNYPDSPYTEDAAQKIKFIREKEAEAEFNIGKFYYRKKAFDAALYRFEKVMKLEPGPAVEEQILYYSAMAYGKTGNDEKSRDYIQQLSHLYPGGKYYRMARNSVH